MYSRPRKAETIGDLSRPANLHQFGVGSGASGPAQDRNRLPFVRSNGCNREKAGRDGFPESSC